MSDQTLLTALGDEIARITLSPDDAEEGIAAFFEKRPPRWTSH